MKLSITQITPSGVSSVLLAWSVSSVDQARTVGMTFSVDRSGSPSGPWQELTTNHTDPFYEDTMTGEANLISTRRDLWYRIRASLAGGDVMESLATNAANLEVQDYEYVQSVGLTPTAGDHHENPTNLFEGRTALQKRLTLVGRVVRRNAAVNLRQFVGVPLVLLKRRTFGERCSVCYNPRTQSSRSAKCADCYGTTFAGGYWTPILIYARITPVPQQTALQESGLTTINKAQVELVSFPPLTQDDVLVEMGTGSRWVIENKQRHASLHRTEITQHWSCSELSRSASVFSYPIDREEIYRRPDVIRVIL